MNRILPLALLLGFVAGRAWSAERPPNILFIYAEDLGYYTGERAAREPNTRITGLKTPNLDALAAQSVNFTRAFVRQSVPALARLLPHAATAAASAAAAAHALGAFFPTAPAPLQPALADACLVCADRLVAAYQRPSAQSLYSSPSRLNPSTSNKPPPAV